MKNLFWMLVGTLLAGCAGSMGKGNVRGIVTDATMNTVTVVSVDNGDTLSFSTMNADRTEAQGLRLGDTLEVSYSGKYQPGMEAMRLVVHPAALVGADRDEHGCIGSAGYTWSEVRKDCIRLFEDGIRTEAVDGSGQVMYVVFSPDSLKAELFSSESEGSEVLERRTLPSGGHVWNVEDDDTKNLRYTDGAWTISRRGKLIFSQPQADNDATLGGWQELHYEGILPAADCPGIRYTLTLRHREHSGDGTFQLQMTYLEAEDGKDVTFSYTGRRLTLRGIPSDADATVWQLLVDGKEKDVFNFLREDDQTLTLLNKDFEKNDSQLNYSLKRTE